MNQKDRATEMPKTHVAGFISTNVDGKSVNDAFLSTFSAFLARLFHTEIQFVTLELQTNVTMLKAGSGAPMLNLRLFHDSDRVDSDSKHEQAREVAVTLAKLMRVPEDSPWPQEHKTYDLTTCHGDPSNEYKYHLPILIFIVLIMWWFS